MRSRVAVASGLGVLLSVLAMAQGTTYKVDRGDIKVAVPLKPGGAFEATTTSLSGTLTLGAGQPLPLSGELKVDLATIDTGIGLRNRHLRENYLELGKGPGFDQAVLQGLRLDDAAGQAFLGKTAFSGELWLHGVKRPVSGTAEVRRAGTGLRVEAEFPLTLTEFGIEPPMYMGVGVASRVLVKVRFVANPAGAAR